MWNDFIHDENLCWIILFLKPLSIFLVIHQIKTDEVPKDCVLDKKVSNAQCHLLKVKWKPQKMEAFRKWKSFRKLFGFGPLKALHRWTFKYKNLQCFLLVWLSFGIMTTVTTLQVFSWLKKWSFWDLWRKLNYKIFKPTRKKSFR